MSRRGLTLLEVMVVALLLAFVIGATFMLFAFGTKGFHQAVARQGVVGQTRGIGVRLRADVEVTHLYSLSIVPRTWILADGTTVRRDGFAFAAMDDWNSPANFQATSGFPIWNRYVVWYATQGESGSLVRQLIDPGSPFTIPVPYAALGSNLDDDPLGNSDLEQSKILSKDVLSLEVRMDEIRQLVYVDLKMRKRGLRTVQGAGEMDEVHQAVFSLRALNTNPEL